MSEAQPQGLVGKIISYQQPPKEPNPAIGKVIEDYPTHKVLEHLKKAKNTIGPTIAYTIVDDKTSLTEVPIIKNITNNGTKFSLENIVSYTLKGHSGILIGRIKKITQDSGGIKLILKHNNKEDVIIPITQSNLSLIVENTDLTDYPVAQLTEVLPFIVGDKVSYSITGNPERAIGEICEININRDGTTFKIKHLGNVDKTMTYKVGETVVGNFTKVDQMSQLTVAPVKKLKIGEGDRSYLLQIGDMVNFTLKKIQVSGQVIDFELKNDPPLIKVRLTDDKEVQIPPIQPNLQKVVEGRQKYILEDVNKYRLKYAKYKAKYLLLK